MTGPPADEVLREIRAAQVSSVFRQMPIALAVNAVNAALTAIVLQRLAGVILPFGWLCAVVLVTAGRLVLWLRYRRASPSEKEDPHWPLLATGGFAAGGFVLGSGRVGSVPHPARQRTDVPDRGYRRHVHGRSGDQRLSPADHSRLPALGEFASRDPVFLPRYVDRQRIGGDGSGLRSSARARCNTLQPFLSRYHATAI